MYDDFKQEERRIFMNNFFAFILLSIIVEGIVTYIKTFFVDKKIQWQQIIALSLGVLVAVAYDIDLLSLFELNSFIPHLGALLTGVLLSRGSNYAYELCKSLTSIEEE